MYDDKLMPHGEDANDRLDHTPGTDPGRDHSQQIDRDRDQQHDHRGFPGEDPNEATNPYRDPRENRPGQTTADPERHQEYPGPQRDEDLENEREDKRDQRIENDPDYDRGEDREIHPEIGDDNREIPLEDPNRDPRMPL